jgi:hypothetical protein
MEGLFVLAGVVLWAGATMKLDTWMRSRQPVLLYRLRPFQGSIADEAQRWLERRADT